MKTDLFPESALKTIAETVRASDRAPSLLLHRGTTNSDLEEQLVLVAEAVRAGTEGAVATTIGNGDGPPALPALTISTNERDVIHYLTVPEGSESKPFLDALFAVASPTADQGSTRTVTGELEVPCELFVFVTPGCPNCPHAVHAAASLAAANSQITASIIDATRFDALAKRFKIRSVPTTVIDGQLSAVGVVSGRRLVRLILDRGGAEHTQRVLASYLDSGRFADAAARLLKTGGAEAFVALWLESSLEQRIGLMLTADHVFEHDPSSLDRIVPRLLDGLSSADLARRGDTADLLGKIAHTSARPHLEALLDDDDEDVVEAAADALAAVAERERRDRDD